MRLFSGSMFRYLLKKVSLREFRLNLNNNLIVVKMCKIKLPVSNKCYICLFNKGIWRHASNKFANYWNVKKFFLLQNDY
jgi:hypothetical protein